MLDDEFKMNLTLLKCKFLNQKSAPELNQKRFF